LVIFSLSIPSYRTGAVNLQLVNMIKVIGFNAKVLYHSLPERQQFGQPGVF